MQAKQIIHTVGNAMSLAKIIFSHHFNNMPIVVICSEAEVKKKKKMHGYGGSAFSLQLLYRYWSEMIVLGLIVFQRAYIKNVDSYVRVLL